LHRDYGIEQCIIPDKKFAIQFLKKIDIIRKLSWQEIQFSSKEGHGTEKISKKSIQKSIPSSITTDVKDFLSFYFHGTKGRIIGYKSKALFHIVYIDTKLEVYNH